MYQKSEQHKQNYKNAVKRSVEVCKLKAEHRKLTYYQNPKLCVQCTSAIPYEKRINKFCSSSCSSTYNNTGRILSEDTRQKISTTHLASTRLRTPYSTRMRNCEMCGTLYKHRLKISRFCSVECRLKWAKSDEGRQASRDRVAQSIANGTHKGWASRTKLKPSYPEQYFINLFHNENIEV